MRHKSSSLPNRSIRLALNDKLLVSLIRKAYRKMSKQFLCHRRRGGLCLPLYSSAKTKEEKSSWKTKTCRRSKSCSSSSKAGSSWRTMKRASTLGRAKLIELLTIKSAVSSKSCAVWTHETLSWSSLRGSKSEERNVKQKKRKRKLSSKKLAWSSSRRSWKQGSSWTNPQTKKD